VRRLVIWGLPLLVVELFATLFYGCGPTCMSDIDEQVQEIAPRAGCGPCGKCAAASPAPTVTHTNGK